MGSIPSCPIWVFTIRIDQRPQVQYLRILSWISCSPKRSSPIPMGRLQLKYIYIQNMYIRPNILSKEEECCEETGFKEKLIFCLSFQKHITISRSRDAYHYWACFDVTFFTPMWAHDWDFSRQVWNEILVSMGFVEFWEWLLQQCWENEVRRMLTKNLLVKYF